MKKKQIVIRFRRSAGAIRTDGQERKRHAGELLNAIGKRRREHEVLLNRSESAFY